MATATAPAVAPIVAVSTETTHGKTVINDGVVSKIVGIATRDVEGVHALGGGTARVIGAIRDAMNNTDLSQGVSVEVGETQVAVDISLVAEYPVALQKVADDVRASVITAISTLVGMEVAEVNITINDVYLPSDDDDHDHEHESRARVQ
ncbi:Asp23/Gls24 family envelope stress response protein [Rathayibacter soli]|uniref:Asp23/Gls24 family envelope stress response protein n=1 Tax=Rathayibacter soli TaxID=3144168 RepID=UPI0027E45149|nr:Asp23/Gls24 family envelope stress response protein [Glaciibacter superstes]